MVDIKKIGIKLKVYKFEFRRKYEYKKSFKVHKKQPIDEIRVSLAKLFSAKKPLKPETSKKQEKSSAFNFAIIGGTVLLAFLLLMGAWVYLTLQSPAELKSPAAIVKPYLQAEVFDTGLITAGDRASNQYVGYLRMAIDATGISNYTVKITPYGSQIPSEVFVLRSTRTQAEGYNEFINVLREEFASRGRVVNEISISDAQQLPGNAVLIIPSGNIPKELLGIGGGSDIMALAQKGNVVIYIGLPFTNMLDGTSVVSTPPEILSLLGIGFTSSSIQNSADGFRLYQPLYGVNYGGSNTSVEKLYGSTTAIVTSDGALIFIPQTLDSGWRNNMEAAAEDISRVIFESRWAVPLATAREYSITSVDDAGLSESGNYDFFTNPIHVTGGSIKTELLATASDGRLIANEWLTVTMDKDAAGELYVKGGYAVTPTPISGQPMRINFLPGQTGNPGGSRFLYVSITNSTGPVGDKTSLGQVSLITESPYDIPVHLDTGEYIAEVVDDSGELYAATYLKVESVDIAYMGQVGKGQYRFNILKGNNLLEEDAANALKVEVIVDDGKYGIYEFEGTSDITIDVLAATNWDDLSFAEHKFTFKLGELEKVVPVSRIKSTSIFENPAFLITLALALGIIGAGVYFGRKEDISYTLDVPEFSPVARTKVSLRSDTILGLFEKVNDSYKWSATPLSLSELKNGFRDMYYNSKPIMISDYNLEYIMEVLERKGQIRNVLEYYMPSSWEAKTKRDARYLCLFRKLRDIFVNNAVPFTARGEESGCDTKITIVGQEMYVHLFDGFDGKRLEAVVLSVLGSVPKGINIIMFVNEAEKSEFLKRLASPSSALIVLKMEIEGGSVLPYTCDEFEKMINELKGFQ